MKKVIVVATLSVSLNLLLNTAGDAAGITPAQAQGLVHLKCLLARQDSGQRELGALRRILPALGESLAVTLSQGRELSDADTIEIRDSAGTTITGRSWGANRDQAAADFYNDALGAKFIQDGSAVYDEFRVGPSKYYAELKPYLPTACDTREELFAIAVRGNLEPEMRVLYQFGFSYWRELSYRCVTDDAGRT